MIKSKKSGKQNALGGETAWQRTSFSSCTSGTRRVETQLLPEIGPKTEPGNPKCKRKKLFASAGMRKYEKQNKIVMVPCTRLLTIYKVQLDFIPTQRNIKTVQQKYRNRQALNSMASVILLGPVSW